MSEYLISGLKQKRSEVARRIVDLRREADKLQADLVAIDSVLRLYDVEPSEIPTKGRMPVRSAYFGRNEITRRCRDMLREKGTIRAEDVSVQAMRDKGLDPENRKLRRDFTRRILVSLHDLKKAGAVTKCGHGRGVLWRLGEVAEPDIDGTGNKATTPIPDRKRWHGLVHSNLTVLRYVFRNIEIEPADVLVDVGCGRGRVLNYWFGLGLKNKLIGIEFDRKTAESAAKAYRKRKNVQIICGDAAEVAAECGGSLFYLFNPLLPDGMSRFEKGLRGKPVRILYYWPRYIFPFENENWQITRIDQGEADFPLAVIIPASAQR